MPLNRASSDRFNFGLPDNLESGVTNLVDFLTNGHLQYGSARINTPKPCIGYEVFGPSKPVTPTFINNSGLNGVPTLSYVTINGESWMRVQWTALTTGVAASSVIAFHTALPFPVGFDTMTMEYQMEAPTLVACINISVGAAIGADASYVNAVFSPTLGLLGTTASNSDLRGTRGTQAVVLARERLLATRGATLLASNTELTQAAFDIFRINLTMDGAQTTAGQVFTFYFRSLYVGSAPRKARLAIVADDGAKSWFRRGMPILNKYNIPATAAIIQAGSANADSLSAAAYAGDFYINAYELKDFIAAGNACVGHGTNSAGAANLFTGVYAEANFATAALATAARLADMNLSRAYIRDKLGVDERSAACYCWPQGVWSNSAGVGAGPAETALLDAAYADGYRLGRSATFLPYAGTTIGAGNPYLAQNYRLMSPKNHAWLVGSLGGMHQYAGTVSGEVFNINAICNVIIPEMAASGLDYHTLFHQVVSDGAEAGTATNISVSNLTRICEALAQQVQSGKLDMVLMPDFIDPVNLKG